MISPEATACRTVQSEDYLRPRRKPADALIALGFPLPSLRLKTISRFFISGRRRRRERSNREELSLARSLFSVLEFAELLKPSIRLKPIDRRIWMSRSRRGRCLGQLRLHRLGRFRDCWGRLASRCRDRCLLASEYHPFFKYRAARTLPRMMLVT